MDGQFEKSGVMCCFCNENIIISDIDPCDINIMANWDKPGHANKRDQMFWCHYECFRSKMHKNVAPYLMLEFLSSDDGSN